MALFITVNDKNIDFYNIIFKGSNECSLNNQDEIFKDIILKCSKNKFKKTKISMYPLSLELLSYLENQKKSQKKQIVESFEFFLSQFDFSIEKSLPLSSINDVISSFDAVGLPDAYSLKGLLTHVKANETGLSKLNDISNQYLGRDMIKLNYEKNKEKSI